MKRTRISILDMYDYTVQEIAQLIILSAKSYMDIEECSKVLALNKALNDYSFWYVNNRKREDELLKLLETP